MFGPVRKLNKSGIYVVILDGDRFFVEDWLFNSWGPFKKREDAILCARNLGWIKQQEIDEETERIVSEELRDAFNMLNNIKTKKYRSG